MHSRPRVRNVFNDSQIHSPSASVRARFTIDKRRTLAPGVTSIGTQEAKIQNGTSFHVHLAREFMPNRLGKTARNARNAGRFRKRMCASAPYHLLRRERLCSIGRFPSVTLRRSGVLRRRVRRPLRICHWNSPLLMSELRKQSEGVVYAPVLIC